MGQSDAQRVIGNDKEALTAEVRAWLERLPEPVRPLRCGADYPHVINRLGSAWADPDRCARVFDDLLLDARGDRHGFPEGIALELARLKNYFETQVHPTAQTVWDEILRRPRQV
jgi:hypothetical protein